MRPCARRDYRPAMDHHTVELLARERIQTFHREAAYRRPSGQPGHVARIVGILSASVRALRSRPGLARPAAAPGRKARVLSPNGMRDG
jgi:hypothetical protein